MNLRLFPVVAAMLIPSSPAVSSLAAQMPPPAVQSPDLAADRKITFRVMAPKAESVRLSSSDLPGMGQGQAMTKGENGLWELAIGPVHPGAYRYNFNVDGVATIDPRNPKTSESNENTWSLVHVPGADWMDTKDVPHGAVAEVTYWSGTLNRFRRLHVYTPPGYEKGQDSYPVFYLLHGAFDSDDSWSTVGRAGAILDNLIAAGKAKPMVVVMPHGHTGPFRFGTPFTDEFEKEFLADILPLTEKRYRVRTDRNSRALAGLSMGGWHTLNIGVPHLEKFGYLGVYSSGVFSISGPRPSTEFEDKHRAILDDAKLKTDFKVFWFAIGKDDFLLETSRATVAMLKKHGFNVDSKETAGAHTWVEWREYLNEFAPLLFR